MRKGQEVGKEKRLAPALSSVVVQATPCSTLQEGAPSFFLTWPDSFSQEIYTGTDRNICHSKPPWSRETRAVSWDLRLLRAQEMLARLGTGLVLLHSPEWRVPGLDRARNVPWDLSGSVQVCGAPRSASLQAGEPPL